MELVCSRGGRRPGGGGWEHPPALRTGGWPAPHGSPPESTPAVCPRPEVCTPEQLSAGAQQRDSHYCLDGNVTGLRLL